MASNNNLNYRQATNVERRTWDRDEYEERAKARSAAAEAAAAAEHDGDGGAKGAPMPSADADGAAKPPPPTLRDQLINDVKKGVGGDDDDGEEFLPAERDRAGPGISRRAYLKARTSRKTGLLDARVGTSEIIAPEAAARSRSSVDDDEIAIAGDGGEKKSIKDGVVQSGVGWHCKVCDCFLKDSLTYLDHINGRKHQRHLGYTMRAERSTLSDVKSRMEALSKEKEATGNTGVGVGGKKRPRSDGDDDIADPERSYEDVVRERDEEARRKKAERARKREERKRRAAAEKEEEDSGGMDPEMAAMMGFGSFGGGRK